MNVLLILGHPRKDSLCGALLEAYRAGAAQAGAEVRTLILTDLAFDPNVHADSPEHQAYEPDIEHALEQLAWADHLVFVYPTWWSNVPALLKGFLDRCVTPGFGFRFRAPDKLAWDGLWKGKSGETITTMDTPPLLHRWFYRQPGTSTLHRGVLGFCGARARGALMFGPVRLSTAAQRRGWLERARRAGAAVQNHAPTGRRRRTTAWLQALRLQFYPMSWAAYTMGALAAAGSAALSSAAYWCGYLCLFALEAATVFSNDYFDHPSDSRNQVAGPFNGGSRVLVDRRLSFGELRSGIAVALVTALVGAILALQLAPLPGTTAVLLGLTLVLTLGYTVPPLKLSHRGLGELDVALTHSAVVLIIGYVLQGGAWQAPLPWLLALPLGASVLPAIILSGLPDRRADAGAGKRTLPVQLGARRAVWLAMAMVGASAVLALLAARAPITASAYRGIVWGAAPHAGVLVLLLLRLLRDHDPADQRVDGTMMVALTYILWFVVVPLWNFLA